MVSAFEAEVLELEDLWRLDLELFSAELRRRGASSSIVIPCNIPNRSFENSAIVAFFYYSPFVVWCLAGCEVRGFEGRYHGFELSLGVLRVAGISTLVPAFVQRVTIHETYDDVVTNEPEVEGDGLPG